MRTVMRMARTTVDVDERVLDAARRALGTAGVTATVNAALIRVARDSALKDFDVTRDIDGTPDRSRPTGGSAVLGPDADAVQPVPLDGRR